MSVRRQLRVALSRLSAGGRAGHLATRAVQAVNAVDRVAPPTLTILTYHRVAEPDPVAPLSPTMVNGTPEQLERQLEAVRTVATPVSADDVVAAATEGRPLPPRAVLVTFDDAYADFATDAWPVLRRHGVAPVLFVPTAYPDDPGRAFWWDRLWVALRSADRPFEADGVVVPDGDPLTAFKHLRGDLARRPHAEAMAVVDRIVEVAGAATPKATVLSWDQLDELARDGVAIAAHSRTHPLLHRMPPAAAAAEIRGSIEDLEGRGFRHARVFAYPGGGVDDRVRAAAADAGCTLAMTTARGTNRLDRWDPLLLRRVNVGGLTTPAALALQLASPLARSARWGGG